MSEMVERVARGIHEGRNSRHTKWEDCSDEYRTWTRKDASAAIEAMCEVWRPIESAPKNQIIDLLFRGNIRIVDCIWYQNSWWSTEQGDPCVRVSNELGQPGTQPTHWMPLPVPPEA